MTRANPTVSVIVPCFNLGAYLDEAVESVLAQTWQDFEIIIVNDGSTDPETNRLLTTYRKPRTRVIQSDNRGLASARNLAIEHATGRYLCALDADDMLAPTFLERTVQILNAQPECTFVSCWLETFGTERWIWRQDRCDLQTLLFECTVATPALVRKQAVLDVGGFDPHMGASGYEDWDLWLSLVERGFAGTIIPEVLFYYRRRQGSMSETCCHGEVHLGLLRYMIRKHDASYRLHLLDLLVRKEAVSAELLRGTYQLERELGSLLPRLQRRQQELARLQRRVEEAGPQAGMRARVTELEEALEASRRENASLAAAAAGATALAAEFRQSLSWRVTGPLRGGYRLLQRLTPTRRPRLSSPTGRGGGTETPQQAADTDTRR